MYDGQIYERKRWRYFSVMAETKNNQAVIKMMDTGKRIDIDMISRLFSKFATRYERGTGF